MAFNFIELKEKEPVDAIYKGFYRAVGAFQKPVHVFKGDDDKTFHVWGTVVLGHLLWGMPFGTKVRITYLGKYKSDDSQYPMKQYEVETLEPPADEK